MDLNKIIGKAKTSKFYLKILNMGLNRMIPFNRPHGFKIVEISDEKIKTHLPYKSRNFNHIHGLHACALATLCEFTTGFMLISRVGMKNYRIILKKLEVEYLYQGKTNAFAEFSLTNDWLNKNVYEPLKENEATDIDCHVEIFDVNKNKLTDAVVKWQLKEWSKVKTKVK